jgi:kynurenine formamidase
MENADLDGLAAAQAWTGVLVVTPLKVQGGTGSPLRALALTP